MSGYCEQALGSGISHSEYSPLQPRIKRLTWADGAAFVEVDAEPIELSEQHGVIDAFGDGQDTQVGRDFLNRVQQ